MPVQGPPRRIDEPTVVQSSPATTAPAVSTRAQKRASLLMIIAFTIIASAGQVFMKLGTNSLKLHPSLVGVVTDVPLILGLALYGIGAVLMVLALRHGELSVLYPLISLSYVWVAVLSVLIFGEILNLYKIGGMFLIVGGVAVLGMGAHK